MQTNGTSWKRRYFTLASSLFLSTYNTVISILLWKKICSFCSYSPFFQPMLPSWIFSNLAHVGDCLAVDLEGSPLCYVHQPNRCLDAEPSSIFVGMEASRLACTSRFGGRQSLELEDVMDLEPVSTSSGSLPFIPKNNF
nr:uncharacterized protein LOC121113518 isoform X1 [Lepeophtheirus salmonis]